jgi:3-oxoacyl-[acyl-carrier-protein] synthase II
VAGADVASDRAGGPGDGTEIVVTGTGVISPAGLGTARLWEAMAAGKTFFDTGEHGDGPAAALPWPVAAVDGSELGWPGGPAWANNRKYANTAAHWAVAVAGQALAEAGLASPGGPDAGSGAVADDPRGGTVMAVGSSGDELGEVIPRLASLARRDPRPLAKLLYDEVPDYSYVRGIPSQLGQFVCMASGFRGSNVAAYGEAAAGGTGALALAVRLLESGELDRVLVVGVHVPPSLTVLAAFEQDEPFGGHATAGAGPFDADRGGTLPGQGAAALLLERADAARGRARATLAACEVLAAAGRGDAARLAVDAAVRRAGRAPTAWWAHGAASPALDRVEAAAVLPALGTVPVTGSKGTIGNAFECSALIDTALAAESLERGLLPPIGLLRRADPGFAGLDPVAGEPRPLGPGGTALVTAFNHGEGARAAGAVVLTAPPTAAGKETAR